MTLRTILIIMNVAIVGTLAEMRFVEHTPVSTLAISAVICFIVLNGGVILRLRAAKRKNSK